MAVSRTPSESEGDAEVGLELPGWGLLAEPLEALDDGLSVEAFDLGSRFPDVGVELLEAGCAHLVVLNVHLGDGALELGDRLDGGATFSATELWIVRGVVGVMELLSGFGEGSGCVSFGGARPAAGAGAEIAMVVLEHGEVGASRGATWPGVMARLALLPSWCSELVRGRVRARLGCR